MQQGYGVFDGLNSGDQSIGARNPYLEEGEYKLLVKRVAKIGRTKEFYIVELEVLESNVPSRPAGIVCSYFIDLTNRDTRGRHITGFLAAVFGFDPTKLPKDSTTTPWDGASWTQYAAWSVSEANPLAGRKVGCRVQQITKQDGDPFTLHNFVPYDQMIIPAVWTVSALSTKAEPAPASASSFSPPNGGFAAPPPMPGAAPQGFGPPAGFNPAAAMPGVTPPMGGTAPLGGFAPPPAPAPIPASIPQEQWLVHPQNPAYEYNPATNAVRARQATQAQQAPMPPQGQPGGSWG